MIEIVFFYPNSDGKGSWSFSLLPNIETFWDAEEKVSSIQLSWLFWGVSINQYFE